MGIYRDPFDTLNHLQVSKKALPESSPAWHICAPCALSCGVPAAIFRYPARAGSKLVRYPSFIASDTLLLSMHFFMFTRSASHSAMPVVVSALAIVVAAVAFGCATFVLLVVAGA